MKKSNRGWGKNPIRPHIRKPGEKTIWQHLRWFHAVIIVVVVCGALLAGTLGIHHFNENHPEGLAGLIASYKEKREEKKESREEEHEERLAKREAGKAGRPKKDRESLPSSAGEETAPAAIEDVWEDDTRKAVTARGVYLTSYAAADEDIRDYVLDLLDETEINTVVITIKGDDGLLAADMGVPLAGEIGACDSPVFSSAQDLKDLLEVYREHGAYAIARIACFRDATLARAKEDCALHWNEENGGGIYVDSQGYYWLDPGNETVQQYLLDISQAACDIGFDEIQYDYVRFPTTYIGRVDYYGGDGYYLADGCTYNEEAARLRQDTITSFIETACETLVPEGVFVSADVYGTIINNEEDSGNVGQDYAAMSHWLDYICPMVYPSHYTDGAYDIDYPDTEPYELVNAALLDSVDALSDLNGSGEHCAAVRPWLQAFTASWLTHYIKYGGEQLRDEINAVYDAGYDEWLIWQSQADYANYRSGIEDKKD
ncbi:MAG: putative glycoside hydrolase [Clostridiales bacterium]|nr:putative glycoside hydrolase [Clostridiales bacterium]